MSSLRTAQLRGSGLESDVQMRRLAVGLNGSRNWLCLILNRRRGETDRFRPWRHGGGGEGGTQGSCANMAAKACSKAAAGSNQVAEIDFPYTRNGDREPQPAPGDRYYACSNGRRIHHARQGECSPN